MNNTISKESGVYQHALKVALCTDPPHQPSTPGLSKLWQSPKSCIALGAVLCTIAIAGIAGVVVLGASIVSVYCILLLVLMGLVCIALLAAGVTLIHQGALHRLPNKPQDILTYLRKRKQFFEETMEDITIQRQQCHTADSNEHQYLGGYKDAVQIQSITIGVQCAELQAMLTQPSGG